ncbi:MAG: hypothetical protein M1837_003262 [Sclerophora amabilis]|nr:MAG: hypothetical protein M1837_003262 [Sclerophora amabilis]
MHQATIFLLMGCLARSALSQQDRIPPPDVKENCDQNGGILHWKETDEWWHCQYCVGGAPYVDPLGNAGCCPPNKQHSFHSGTQKGKCCEPGTQFNGATCERPHNPEVCSGADVCPQSDHDLGIQYGHCYVMTDIGGNWFGVDHQGVYKVGGENSGTIFRVCKDKTDCSVDISTPVPLQGGFFMQDQMGPANGNGFGWWGDNTPHMAVQQTSDNAAHLSGDSTCYNGKCAICLNLVDGGLSSPCEMPRGTAHVGRNANPNTCKSFHFQEVKCRQEKKKT